MLFRSTAKFEACAKDLEQALKSSDASSKQFEGRSKSMSPCSLQLKTSSGLRVEDRNSAKALGKRGLLVLGEDDKPGRVGASVAGEDHVASGPQALGFLNQHFALAVQADGNLAVLPVGYLDGGGLAQLGGLGGRIGNVQPF